MKIMRVTTVMISGPVMIMIMMMSMVESARNTGILAAPLTACKPTGYLQGNIHDCGGQSSSECCKAGEKYAQYTCSPPVKNATAATMTWNLFEDDDIPSCDGRFHNSNQLVVSLSTGWYAGGRRCGTYVEIANPENGGKVRALVVDECDSFHGCDAEHAYSPPCNNNDVDASPAVWKALGINNGDGGSEIHITWSDA